MFAGLRRSPARAANLANWHRMCFGVTSEDDHDGRMNMSETETLAKVEVLADLEEVVQKLMISHESKRILWFPSELLSAPPDTDPDQHIRDLRRRAEGVDTPARVALAFEIS